MQRVVKTGGFASLHHNFLSRLSRTTSRKVIPQKYNLWKPTICQNWPAQAASFQMKSTAAHLRAVKFEAELTLLWNDEKSGQSSSQLGMTKMSRKLRPSLPEIKKVKGLHLGLCTVSSLMSLEGGGRVGAV